MKFQRIPVLLVVIVFSGCDAGKTTAPRPAPGAPARQQSPTQPQTEPGALLSDAKPAGDAPASPGATIYSEVLAAIDEIIGVLEQEPPTAAELRRATQRFHVASGNWKLYLANGGDSELAALEQSRIAEHAVTSGEKLRENILKVARDPAKGDLRPELQKLLRAMQQAMSATERAAFQKWTKENGLEN